MSERYRDYRQPVRDPGRGTNPPRVRRAPTRAWLQPTQDRHPWRPDRTSPQPWSMFLEETRENIDGPFDSLVLIARSRGVHELHVWSTSRLTFELLDPRSDCRPE